MHLHLPAALRLPDPSLARRRSLLFRLGRSMGRSMITAIHLYRWNRSQFPEHLSRVSLVVCLLHSRRAKSRLRARKSSFRSITIRTLKLRFRLEAGGHPLRCSQRKSGARRRLPVGAKCMLWIRIRPIKDMMGMFSREREWRLIKDCFSNMTRTPSLETKIMLSKKW